jgi:hypothetical protein
LYGKITENEVLLAAKYMKYGKAPGYDMVVNEYIKSTLHLFLPLYVELFNNILDNDVIPECWTSTISYPGAFPYFIYLAAKRTSFSVILPYKTPSTISSSQSGS